MDKRRMCPHCRAFVTTSDKVCPYCDMKLGERAIDRRSPSDIGGLVPAAHFTTSLILLINIGLFIATIVFSAKAREGFGFGPDGQTLAIFGAKHGALIRQGGEWWRLVTAGFLHGGVLHILMNSWALMSLGAAIEQLYGTTRFIVFYFVATVLGFYLSLVWSPMSLSVGASAGIFGLIGAMIAYGMQHRGGSELKAQAVQWAVYGLVMGLLPGLNIDNAAHIGGLAGGFGMAWLAGAPRLVADWRDQLWKIAAGIAILATVASFAMMALTVGHFV